MWNLNDDMEWIREVCPKLFIAPMWNLNDDGHIAARKRRTFYCTYVEFKHKLIGGGYPSFETFYCTYVEFKRLLQITRRITILSFYCTYVEFKLYRYKHRSSSIRLFIAPMWNLNA